MLGDYVVAGFNLTVSDALPTNRVVPDSRQAEWDGKVLVIPLIVADARTRRIRWSCRRVRL